MDDTKFSCPQCGQHISCDEAWAGHKIECPACHDPIVVPQVAATLPAPPPTVSPGVPSKAAGPRLSAGVTQVARSTAHAPAALKKIIPRRPRSSNSLLGYAILVLVIAAVAGVGYFYGLPLLKDALQQAPSSGPPAGAGNSQNGGSRGGPMGGVNEALDVSETLDGGSSPRTPSVPATNNAARPKPNSPRR
jgi:hypothetical protein